MIIDATFWVAVSFFIFIGVLVYFKIPQKISDILNENIKIIKSEIDDAEKLKDESKSILSEYEKKISNSKTEIKQMKNQALKDIKNASVKISIKAVEVLLKNSLDKNKLNKIFTSSVDETKLALKRTST